mmetsp:Transcript_12601/g.1886  ORF Transcript_12601/g.1886 Transcript_12601/m.1886 type:complete len:91 (+) Transcript_12601:1920-2192(+)
MGFGLHVGWAIEGAVGSSLKIDACYLSPNVTMASRLEDATKEYSVPIIFSEDLYNINSPEAREFFRKLDRIYLKGAKSPMDIYTVDLDVS